MSDDDSDPDPILSRIDAVEKLIAESSDESDFTYIDAELAAIDAALAEDEPAEEQVEAEQAAEPEPEPEPVRRSDGYVPGMLRPRPTGISAADALSHAETARAQRRQAQQDEADRRRAVRARLGHPPGRI